MALPLCSFASPMPSKPWVTLKQLVKPAVVASMAASSERPPVRHRKNISADLSLIIFDKSVMNESLIDISGYSLKLSNIGFLDIFARAGTPTKFHSTFVLTSTR